MAIYDELQVEFSVLPKNTKTWTDFDYNQALELGNRYMEYRKKMEEEQEDRLNTIEDLNEILESLTNQNSELGICNKINFQHCEELEEKVADLKEENGNFVKNTNARKSELEELRKTKKEWEVKCEMLEKDAEKLKETLKTVKEGFRNKPEIEPHVCCKCKAEKLQPSREGGSDENSHHFEIENLVTGMLLEIHDYEIKTELNKKEVVDYEDQILTSDYQNVQLEEKLGGMDSIERDKFNEIDNTAKKQSRLYCGKCGIKL